ncbi:DUF1289 domain-containing protein [Palleronia rufa]|uniref:DUF1289 domain-containing protein n=1 Tax=Palleronia rufa TaxID=1530186 RepID=UPI0005623CA3|nr:DUF1289 domain-containing protein [Palleronia rufa]
MSDDLWRRAEIESPCIKVCVIDPRSRLCAGCLRSLEEIAGWSAMSPEARAEAMADLPSRAGRLSRRRGGRAGRRPQSE